MPERDAYFIGLPPCALSFGLFDNRVAVVWRGGRERSTGIKRATSYSYFPMAFLFPLKSIGIASELRINFLPDNLRQNIISMFFFFSLRQFFFRSKENLKWIIDSDFNFRSMIYILNCYGKDYEKWTAQKLRKIWSQCFDCLYK